MSRRHYMEKKEMATKKVEKLAIDGGKKVWTKGFPAWPQFDRKTDKKVLDILHSGKVNYWTGPRRRSTWRLRRSASARATR